MTLAAVLCCTMMTTVFTACGDDDDDNVRPREDRKPVAAVMDYSLRVSNDMLSTFDLTIEYYDENGKVQTEAMTKKEWKKNVKAQLPATLGARVKARLKDGVDPATIERVFADYGYNYQGHTENASGSAAGNSVLHGNDFAVSLTSESINIWLERNAGGFVKFLINFAADGTPTSGNWQ